MVDVERVAEAMHEMVLETHGSRRVKATDLTKAMLDRFRQDGCDRTLCKTAIRLLIDGGRCCYSDSNCSYIVPSE